MPMPQRPMSMAMMGAVNDLGLGDMLRDQVGTDTEELRKKRMLQQQRGEQMGPAAMSLFGGMGGGFSL